jgi:hypothetical protein
MWVNICLNMSLFFFFSHIHLPQLNIQYKDPLLNKKKFNSKIVFKIKLHITFSNFYCCHFNLAIVIKVGAKQKEWGLNNSKPWCQFQMNSQGWKRSVQEQEKKPSRFFNVLTFGVKFNFNNYGFWLTLMGNYVFVILVLLNCKFLNHLPICTDWIKGQIEFIFFYFSLDT